MSTILSNIFPICSLILREAGIYWIFSKIHYGNISTGFGLRDHGCRLHFVQVILLSIRGELSHEERFSGLMPIDPARTQYYKRARFTTRLPTHYLYARSHFWLLQVEPGLWRVGLTHFATRMLGDFVECEFQIPVGDSVKIGQPIGWVEGFKAVADIFCVAEGDFAGFNTELNQKPELVDKDAYDRGWMFMVRGTPDATCVDCAGYVALLDQAVDRILSQTGEGHGEDQNGEDQNGEEEPPNEGVGGPWEKKGKC